MALISCKECSSEVSDQAFKCPSCGAVLKKPKRGIFGKIIKFLFIAFNILMILWLAGGWMNVAQHSSELTTDAARAGAAIGSTLATGFIMTIWVFGDIILGILVLLTRPKTG